MRVRLLIHNMPNNQTTHPPVSLQQRFTMLQYQDVWTGSGYRRQIQGCTLQIVLQPTDSQHNTAALQLHNYCSFFGHDGPLVIGRGCHNIWRPYGSASRGTKALSALEVFSLDKPRETFISIYARDPNNRQYLPGEVVVYGQGEMAVCLDSSETAIRLAVYSVSDPVMADFPSHIASGTLGNKHLGFNLCNPIYALAGVLGQWTRMRMDVAQLMNNPAHYEWCMHLEGRLRLLEEDINDFRLLCYSQSKLDGVKVGVDDDALVVTRRNVVTYLRSFVGNDAYTEGERQLATSHFVEIGLFERPPPPPPPPPQHNIQGQIPWYQAHNGMS